MRISPSLAALLVVVSSVSVARAWDPLGHMLTMKIAQGELTPKASAELDAAIARFNAKEKPDAPYDAVTAACWMDDARSKTKEYNEWHYINLPFTREGLPVPEGSPSSPNVVWGIDQCGEIMKGNATDSVIDRDQALIMLLHLVGDIQQPLHTTDRGDAGGNRVRIANLKDEQSDLIFSKGGNLHFFWDSAYRRVFKDGKAAVTYAAPLYLPQTPVAGHLQARELVDQEAAAIRREFPPGSVGVPLEGNPSDWAVESHALGFDLAYGKLPSGSPVELDEPYVDSSRTCAQKRIAIAGYRLAALLNRLLDPAGK